MCVLPTSLLEFITVYTTMTHKVTCTLELHSVYSLDILSNIHGYLSSSGQMLWQSTLQESFQTSLLHLKNLKPLEC